MNFDLKTEIDIAITYLFGALKDNRFDGEDLLKITEAECVLEKAHRGMRNTSAVQFLFV